MERKKAMFYEKTADDTVICRLCPHGCAIAPGRHGLCLARKNEGGELIAASYGKITSLALDPIEKKPLARFYPGSKILSVGSYGCNFKCAFCQNHDISQREPLSGEMEPERLIETALGQKEHGSIGVAFTYNEPLVGFEYVYDSARLAKAHGLKTVVVTNGFVCPEPMKTLLPYVDAMNIDLKAFTQEFYADLCRGSLGPVQDIIALCAAACHVEVTTLIIPGHNDTEKEIASLAGWLAAVSPQIVLHLTRHHPDYHMMKPAPADVEHLRALAAAAAKKLPFVCLGNC